jgi:bifunctional non-homologous end joining protein LigD
MHSSSSAATASKVLRPVKHDGYRLIARKRGIVVRLFTRRGFDWTERYPASARPWRHCGPHL